MASAKTVVKKSSRRRGTVSLTKVRKAVHTVFAQYASARAPKTKRATVGAATSR